MSEPATHIVRDDQFFWDGLQDGKLLVRVCDSCGRGAFPPMPGCPHCGHASGHVVESSGEATLYTWTVCHVAFDPAFVSDVPYIVGVVELPERARLVARVEGVAEDAVVAGMTLVASFRSDDGGQPSLTFIPLSGGSPS